MIEIELSSPPQVRGQPARPQTLWLLMRLWLAARTGDGTGWVREAQLRERFSNARNLRMVISRAYADFARWEIQVGWGTDRSRSPDLLPLAGRNRGPYWLVPGEADRLKILRHGQPAGMDDVIAWLGMPTTPQRRDLDLGDGETGAADAGAAYWHAWAGARRDMLDGRLIVDGDHGALAGYRRAQGLTDDARLQAAALLQQAMVWRRAGNADAARAVLAELDRHWRDIRGPEHAWLGAMAAIVQAWCAYAGRDPVRAQEILRAAIQEPRWVGLFQHHPRVRSEYANLQALIHRAMALDDALPRDERNAAAHEALRYYRSALALANEAELFDSAASTAGNLGWSLWLFARCGLDTGGEHDEPLQWIALAAWLKERHAVGGGCWNSIYLLRIARGGGPETAHPSEREFRRWPVLTPAQFKARTAPIALAAEWSRWLDLATALQADVDSGRLQVDALQRANLLLELAWYEAHEGDVERSAAAAARLRRRLRELTPSDRLFFRNALRRLPGK